MVKKLLHRCAGVLARVYVHFFCGECGMQQTGVLSTSACARVYAVQMFLTSVYIFANALSTGRARVIVYALFFH